MTVRSEEEIRAMLKHTERHLKKERSPDDVTFNGVRLVTDEAWASALRWVLMEDPMNSPEVLREQ